jgi:hypothetical protein
MIIELNPLSWLRKKPTTASVKRTVEAVTKPELKVELAVPIELAAGMGVFVPAGVDVVKSVAQVAEPKESVMATTAVTVPAKGNKFVSFLKSLLHGAEKGLAWAVKYALPIEKLVVLLFPQVKAEADGVVSATGLIQKAVILVEQKYAASGAASGTGAQKLAEVLELTEDAVVQLLKQEGIDADTSYITGLVNAVVSILNVQSAAPQAG